MKTKHYPIKLCNGEIIGYTCIPLWDKTYLHLRYYDGDVKSFPIKNKCLIVNSLEDIVNFSIFQCIN